jgi:hypothetical protein
VKQSMTMPSGLIEVDLFSGDVNSDSHPDAIRLRKILEEVAAEYHCQLIHYEIREGTVAFSFDSDGAMADILKILQGPPDAPASEE